jgi:uncharacterized protein YndB with AHSA1/START domain
VTASSNPSAQQTGEQFVLTHVFDAPRDIVFKAWTERDRLMQWWGPQGTTMLDCTLDLRPGGVFHYGMRTPDGQEMWGKWVFREVVVPERLTFVVSFSDADGNVVRAPFGENWPLEVLSTVAFAEDGGKTTLTMTGMPFNATDAERQAFGAAHGSLEQGWAGTISRLDDYLTSVMEGKSR